MYDAATTLLWIVFGIAALPMWALDHARPPFTCEAFHRNYPADGRALSIGYCVDTIQTNVNPPAEYGFTEVEIYIYDR